MNYKIFTISSGFVRDGAGVENLTLSSGSVIQAITIGEEDRGRWREILSVQGLKDDQNIYFGEIGKIKSGRKKLLSRQSATTNEKIIVVFRTKIGFRGSNSHTGDRASNWNREDGGFLEFPGEQLTKRPGIIAQGIAGRAGAGEQIIALMPKGVVFRTSYGGRLYGSSPSHYYKWDGKTLLHATWEEREILDQW